MVGSLLQYLGDQSFQLHEAPTICYSGISPTAPPPFSKCLIGHLHPPSVKTGFVKATCNEIFAHQALNERKGGTELPYGGGGECLKNSFFLLLLHAAPSLQRLFYYFGGWVGVPSPCTHLLSSSPHQENNTKTRLFFSTRNYFNFTNTDNKLYVLRLMGIANAKPM